MYFFLLSLFVSHFQRLPKQGFQGVTPARSRIFGANIDINLKSCKQNRIFFRKMPKKLSKNRVFIDFLTFKTSFLPKFAILEVRSLRCSRERDDITDVLHAGDE